MINRNYFVSVSDKHGMVKWTGAIAMRGFRADPWGVMISARNHAEKFGGADPKTCIVSDMRRI